MTRYFTLILGILMLALPGCGNSSLQDGDDNGAGDGNFIGRDDQICTSIAAAALSVRVVVPTGWDAEQLRRELQIQVTDAKGPVEMMDLQNEGSTLSTAGAYENQGPMTLRVTLRATSNSLANLVPMMDTEGCHPSMMTVSVEFQPPNKIVLTKSN
jgi:hypothetical protein